MAKQTDRIFATVSSQFWLVIMHIYYIICMEWYVLYIHFRVWKRSNEWQKRPNIYTHTIVYTYIHTSSAELEDYHCRCNIATQSCCMQWFRHIPKKNTCNSHDLWPLCVPHTVMRRSLSLCLIYLFIYVPQDRSDSIQIKDFVCNVSRKCGRRVQVCLCACALKLKKGQLMCFGFVVFLHFSMPLSLSLFHSLSLAAFDWILYLIHVYVWGNDCMCVLCEWQIFLM